MLIHPILALVSVPDSLSVPPYIPPSFTVEAMVYPCIIVNQSFTKSHGIASMMHLSIRFTMICLVNRQSHLSIHQFKSSNHLYLINLSFTSVSDIVVLRKPLLNFDLYQFIRLRGQKDLFEYTYVTSGLAHVIYGTPN